MADFLITDNLDDDAVVDGIKGKIRFEGGLEGSGAPVAPPSVPEKVWTYYDMAEDPSAIYSWSPTAEEWFPAGTTGDHDDLTGRSAADQHPMSAITGLDAAIGTLVSLSPALVDNNTYVTAETTVDPRLVSQGGAAHGTLVAAGTFPLHLAAIDGNVRGRQVFLVNKSGTQTIDAPSGTLVDSTGATVSSITLTAGQAAICTAYLDTSGPDDIWRVDILAPAGATAATLGRVTQVPADGDDYTVAVDADGILVYDVIEIVEPAGPTLTTALILPNPGEGAGEALPGQRLVVRAVQPDDTNGFIPGVVAWREVLEPDGPAVLDGTFGILTGTPAFDYSGGGNASTLTWTVNELTGVDVVLDQDWSATPMAMFDYIASELSDALGVPGGVTFELVGGVMPTFTTLLEGTDAQLQITGVVDGAVTSNFAASALAQGTGGIQVIVPGQTNDGTQMSPAFEANVFNPFGQTAEYVLGSTNWEPITNRATADRLRSFIQGAVTFEEHPESPIRGVHPYLFAGGPQSSINDTMLAMARLANGRTIIVDDAGFDTFDWVPNSMLTGAFEGSEGKLIRYKTNDPLSESGAALRVALIPWWFGHQIVRAENYTADRAATMPGGVQGGRLDIWMDPSNGANILTLTAPDGENIRTVGASSATIDLDVPGMWSFTRTCWLEWDGIDPDTAEYVGEWVLVTAPS